MSAIFISYRRSDAEGQAGRLFKDLCEQFGKETVFIDVAGLAKGLDFRRVLDDRLASCGVLLAIIGKDWLTATDEKGQRRLHSSHDFVRLETSAALKRDIPVIPVLVQGTRMPRVDELPEDLKELAFRNGTELTHARWESDVQELIKAIAPYVQGTSSSAPSPSRPQPGLWWRIAGPAMAVVVLVAIGYVGIRNDQKETAARADAAEQKAEVAPAAAERDRLAREKAEADERAKADMGRRDAETRAQERAAGGAAVQRESGLVAPPKPRVDYQVARRGAFRSPLRVGAKLHFYDIDSGVQLDAQSGQADFFFKPDDLQNPATRIGVDALNGAKYAPRFAGLFPWEVEPGGFVSSGGVISVDPGVDIPCFTSDNRPCTFQVRVEPQGEMFVSVALYK